MLPWNVAPLMPASRSDRSPSEGLRRTLTVKIAGMTELGGPGNGNALRTGRGGMGQRTGCVVARG
ncbi:hypothetical protein D7S89_24695 [Trinickia fusca]|uniref:Uncharacterized protein n=1 Tax=Trinickia fusca TaxID=2419777 RepID=A0A494WZB5_9BURK|nr:hypothetical protein D7S89_24695 [Trinickia fusca]